MSLYTYKCEVVRVIDGDTLELNVDCGFGIWKQDRFRLAGLNAPEKNTDEGKAAALFVRQWIPLWTTVTTAKDKQEKYGRYLATITDTATGESLNQALLDSGHAKPY